MLTTFSETLANALRSKLRLLISNEPRLGERIEVHAMNSIGRRLYEVNLGKLQIASGETIRQIIEEASNAAQGNRFSLHFLMTEWEQVVDGWQLDTWEAYRDVSRLGRKTRLKEPQRASLWSIFEDVRSETSIQRLITYLRHVQSARIRTSRVVRVAIRLCRCRRGSGRKYCAA